MSVTTLVRDWNYAPSRPPMALRLSRWKSRVLGRVAPPAREAIRPVAPVGRWNGLFLYAPEGRITPAQLFSLDRLSELPGRCAVVCATPRPQDVPVALLGKADALYWKGIAGFDFSAYALLLNEIALRSPGADLYLQNDSVLGPFGNVEALIEEMPWRVGGFMASSGGQNHLQSYALFFRRVEPAWVSSLSAIFPTRWAYDRYRDVVNLQETRMASVAARHASVGASWYAPRAHEDEPSVGAILRRKLGVVDEPPRCSRDPSLCDVDALLAQGFPFLKRSLFTRNADLHPRAPLDAFLAAQGHPPMDVAP